MAGENGAHHESGREGLFAYVDEFIKLTCAPDLLQLGLFPNTKEITETIGMWTAARKYLDLELTGKELEDHNAIVFVGDGFSPRTAALFAFLSSNWTCYSVDPALRLKGKPWIKKTSSASSTMEPTFESSIKNLILAARKVQEVRIKAQKAIIVLLHAHVTLQDCLEAIECDELVGVIACPCCNNHAGQSNILGKEPCHVYTDRSIVSAHNQVRVWTKPGLASAFSTKSTSKPEEVKELCTDFQQIKIEMPMRIDSNCFLQHQYFFEFTKNLRNEIEWMEKKSRNIAEPIVVILYVESRKLVEAVSHEVESVFQSNRARTVTLTLTQLLNLTASESVGWLESVVGIIDLEALCVCVAGKKRKEKFKVVKSLSSKYISPLISKSRWAAVIVLSKDYFYKGSLLHSLSLGIGGKSQVEWKGKQPIPGNSNETELTKSMLKDSSQYRRNFSFLYSLHITPFTGTKPNDNLILDHPKSSYTPPDESVTIQDIWHEHFSQVPKPRFENGKKSKVYIIAGLVIRYNRRRNFFEIFDHSLSTNQRYLSEWAKCWPCKAQRRELKYITAEMENEQTSSTPLSSRPYCLQIHTEAPYKMVRRGDTIEVKGRVGFSSKSRLMMFATEMHVVQAFSDNLKLKFPRQE